MELDYKLYIEKQKRGKFTYFTLPPENMEPSKQSLKNATRFVTNIKNIINE